jgi:hypothetical protein
LLSFTANFSMPRNTALCLSQEFCPVLNGCCFWRLVNDKANDKPSAGLVKPQNGLHGVLHGDKLGSKPLAEGEHQPVSDGISQGMIEGYHVK